jgi:hypothetical protein
MDAWLGLYLPTTPCSSSVTPAIHR